MNLNYFRTLCYSLFGLAMCTTAFAKPVPLPNPGITGYNFPESKETLMSWINNGNAQSISLHGWGLWTSLTAPSGQSEFGLTNVPVYVTWLSPAEIAALPQPSPAAVNAPKRQFKLEQPRQFSHKGVKVEQAIIKNSTTSPSAASSSTAAVVPDTAIAVTMGYDPSAQAFAHSNNLFSLTALQKIYNSGTGPIRAIPTFPNTAVTIKPTYKIISSANMINGSIYVMPAWPGTPPVITKEITEKGFPESVWPGCVYINTKNASKSSATGVDPDCKTGPTAANTFGLGDFINFAVTSNNIANFETLTGETLSVGDFIILIAMHVTTREIDEWTWQTYFWTPNPANPPLPSSKAIASARPAQLTGAAAHYAMAIGYQMVAPNQPIIGGKSVGSPVTVYNPYLESPFSAAVFGAPPVNVGIQKSGAKKPYMATVGVQSNCMTCHGNASINPSNPDSNTNSLPYLTNFYVSRDDAAFTGYLQTDFLWSIQGTAK